MTAESEQNWEAVDGSQAESEKKNFFINVCHRVLQAGKAKNCPEGAAVCAVGELHQRELLSKGVWALAASLGET